MAAASVTNSFTAATAAVASQVNRNFTDLVDFANDNTVHRDGSKPFTGAMSMGSNKITNVTAGTADNDAVNVAQLSNTTPAGTITMYGNAVAPSAWLLCDGAEYSRAAYSVLFAVIGTSYGVGDGGTTFNVPNMSAKFPYGGTPGSTGGSNDAVVVSHDHSLDHDHPSVNTSEIAAHQHLGLYVGADNSYATEVLRGGAVAFGGSSVNGSTTDTGFAGQGRYQTGEGGAHSHSVDLPIYSGNTGSEGVSGTDLNRPAFVGVTFIIKSGL